MLAPVLRQTPALAARSHLRCSSALPRLSRSLSKTTARDVFDYSPEVEQAIRSQNGTGINSVVALESTIITHGMPYPTNLEAARRVEDAVRSQGAVPATIAVIDGRVKIGLSESELQRVAESPNDSSRKAIKAGTRELPYVLGLGNVIGGTTVSGTSAICSLAGISIFATGGIGGVHRGGETTFDVSADLVQLGKSPINVFCSGAKSILDIPRTLEYLETHSVGVFSLNPSGEFPAFFTSKSGHFVPSVSDIDTIARIIYASRSTLQSQQGAIWAVPIPSEYEEQGALIQRAVEQAVRESHEQGIDQRGKEATPWLLARVNELTKGQSLKSNVELVVNNATVAAKTAVRSAQLQRERRETSSYRPGISLVRKSSPPALLVFGCAAIDIVTETSHQAPGSTSPGTVSLTSGGVANNIAQAAANVLRGYDGDSMSVRLVAPVRDDLPGQLLRRAVEEKGLSSDGLFSQQAGQTQSTTPMVVLNLNAEHDLVDGVASTSLVEEAFTTDTIAAQLARAEYDNKASKSLQAVIMDGNLSESSMADLIRWRIASTDSPRALIFETTSTAKCTRIMKAIAQVALTDGQTAVDVITPNIIELEKLVQMGLELGVLSDVDGRVLALPSIGSEVLTETDLLFRAQVLCGVLSPLVPTILVTLGARGVLSAHRTASGLTFQHHELNPAHLPKHIVSTTGAGDSFTGAVSAYAVAEALRRLNSTGSSSVLADERSIAEAVTIGQLASACSLEVWDPVDRVNTEHRCGKLLRNFMQYTT